MNDGENENVLDEAEVESGYVPKTPPKSDQGSDREPAEKRPRDYDEEKMVPRLPEPEPDSDDPSSRNIPELEGNLLFQHESIGVIGHMIVVVMHVCKHVVGHLLVV